MTITTIKEVNLAPSILAKLGNVTRIEYNPADTFPIDVKAGDVVLITAAGTVNGISFEAPDANGNREGFIVNSVAPLKITPCVRAKPATATVAGVITDAPSDGKQYARKDGDWEEVTGGAAYEGYVTVTLGSGGDYANINDLSDAMASRRGEQLTIQLISNVTMIRRQAELDGWGLVIFDLNGFNGGSGQTVQDSTISGLGTFGSNMAFNNVHFWTDKKTLGTNTTIQGGSISCELELGSSSVIFDTLLSPTSYGSAKITATTNAMTLQNCSSLYPVTLQSPSATLSKFTLRGGIILSVTLINAIAVIGYGSTAITATSASSTNAWPSNEAPVMVAGGNFNGNTITVTGANAPQYNVFMSQGMANVYGMTGLAPTVSNSNWASATPTTNGIYFGA